MDNQILAPQAGKDYPQSWNEFLDWFATEEAWAAAWYVTNQKLGVSALGLKRVLGLGSYETAWTMLHRFRRAMVRPQRDC